VAPNIFLRHTEKLSPNASAGRAGALIQVLRGDW
jgi:hypothetical protein